MDLETDEAIVWKGRPAYHLRYPLLAVAFFAGIFVIDLGPIGRAVGAASTLLWIAFSILSVVILVLDKEKSYYLTNRRVISHKSWLIVSDLSNVRMEQSTLGRWRDAGNVYFDSSDGRWIVFRHVKDPRQIVQSGLSLRGAPASEKICNYCGAHVPSGLAKCPSCGADI